jgi:hypothetical protein
MKLRLSMPIADLGNEVPDNLNAVCAAKPATKCVIVQIQWTGDTTSFLTRTLALRSMHTKQYPEHRFISALPKLPLNMSPLDCVGSVDHYGSLFL